MDIDERTVSGTPMEDTYGAFHRRFYGYKREQRAEKTALADSVVRANRDNLVGAVALEDLAHVDADRFLSLYELLPAHLQEFYLVKSAYDAIMIQRTTAPGQPFTDYLIAGGNPDGTDVKLSDYVGRGRYILLDHWASWCGPCKAEMPFIKKTWEAFHGDRFDVVSIAVSDKRADTEQALSTLDMPWNQILDAQRIPLELYGVTNDGIAVIAVVNHYRQLDHILALQFAGIHIGQDVGAFQGCGRQRQDEVRVHARQHLHTQL